MFALHITETGDEGRLCIYYKIFPFLVKICQKTTLAPYLTPLGAQAKIQHCIVLVNKSSTQKGESVSSPLSSTLAVGYLVLLCRCI
jgi:hypothetical protein